MPAPRSPFHTCLFFTSAALARTLDRSAREHFGAVELSPTQGFILIGLRSAPGISVSDLAALLVLDQSTVTKTLDKMVSKGLVQREVFGHTVRVFLTGRGERLETDARAAWKKVQLAYQALVGEGEVKHLCTVINSAQVKLTEVGK